MKQEHTSAQERRTQRVEVRLTQSEEKSLIEKAQASGNTVSDFLRKVMLNAKPRIQQATPFRAELIKGLASLGKIGSNVNQIARALNRSKDDAAMRVSPDLVNSVLAELKTLSTHLIRVLTDGH